jgi:hypothetical protein
MRWKPFVVRDRLKLGDDYRPRSQEDLIVRKLWVGLSVPNESIRIEAASCDVL